MVAHYLDTSAAVPAFVREAGTDSIQNWLDRQPEGGVAISPWVAVEFSSALSIKLRAGALTGAVAAAAHAEWRRFAESVRTIEITSRHFDEAARIAAREGLGVRAGDALHLAVAAAAGCTLATFDAALAAAARELGLPVAAI